MTYTNSDALPISVIRQAAAWMWEDATLEDRESYLRAAMRSHARQDSDNKGFVAVPVGDLEELAASIKGDRYMGEEWEIKCIEAILSGAVADRQDAERYRWLREQGTIAEGNRHPQSWYCLTRLADLGGEYADEAIDAARAKEGKA